MTRDEVRARVEADWPLSGGKNAYIRILSGDVRSRADALEAKCAECCGGYVDGKKDCGITNCPLYPWMPYRKEE